MTSHLKKTHFNFRKLSYILSKVFKMKRNNIVTKKKNIMFDETYLSSSDPMSTAMPFRSPNMLLKSESASSCFAFSDYLNINIVFFFTPSYKATNR